MWRLLVGILFSALLMFADRAMAQPGDRVFYAGADGAERFNDVHRLSDGSWLVAGQAENLDWLAAAVPRQVLPSQGIASSAQGSVGFLLHLSADLESVKRVLHFPPGTVRDVFRIRSTELPGQATGVIYVSGSRDGSSPDGYYIARLRGNLVDAPISGIDWAANVPAGGPHKERQPWDVAADGSVLYALGLPSDFNWAAIEKLDASGQRAVVPHWHAHWSDRGEWNGTPSSTYPNASIAPLRYSALVMKAGRRGSLRSYTRADYELLGMDANGNGGRRGRFPDDYYFNSHCELAGGSSCPNSGRGYTGYRVGSAVTQRVGGIVIDRRDGSFYFGYGTHSVLPPDPVSGRSEPDIEPAVVAMDAQGRLLWWDRMYRETPSNSTPDQYVDGLAIDYVRNRLLVLGRAHGNNTNNLWRGNEIALNPGAQGFQNQFTGTKGDSHLSWLGSYRLADGRILAATYIAEYVEGPTNFGPPHPDPHLGGWPNPNAGWPNLNTTRCGADNGYAGEIEIGPGGEPVVMCTGRRPITTVDAFQPMPRPNATPYLAGSWSQFVRVYSPGLDRVLYSTLLNGQWDTQTGEGGDNIRLGGMSIAPEGVLLVGRHRNQSGTTSHAGRAMPVTGVPVWAAAAPRGQSAVVARFSGSRLWGAPELPPPSTSALWSNGFEPRP